MIGRLRGTIVGRGSESLVLDVNGTGFEVSVTPRALAKLPGVGEEAVLHTHLHVREDNMALYGFPAESDRDIFRLLLGASGVGPKVAMAICATLGPEDLRGAVLGDDTATLETVPGIGKRSAQKLIIELRPRLELPDGDLPAGTSISEVRQALEGLGYQAAEIRQTLSELPVEGDVEDLLRRALRALGSAQ